MGLVVKLAERIKLNHYTHFIFIPVTSETTGVIGKLGSDLIKKIGSKIADTMHEKQSTSYLLQHISIAIQKDNGTSILRTIQPSKYFSEIFYL